MYALLKFLEQEGVFVVLDQAVTFHLAQFAGHRTTVDAEIVGKLLTIEWDGKLLTPLGKGLF